MAKRPLSIDTLTHDEATRKNAPTAELEAFVPPDIKTPIVAAYERRNRDLDPQLVWRGKDVADWSDLVVNAPPLYIQEKIHPKALIEDLKRYQGAGKREQEPDTCSLFPDLFSDFNGIAPDQRTEFYEHDQHWSNRMILGDGLQVMASLAEREGLKGQVQCIYIDPPYGIKFNSNFQWSTTSRDVKDGKADHLTREPEQVKAFRDTWRDGIHSYLTYLRDRLTVARDLLTDSGSIFVQIGDENVHRVRALMDEVFGEENFVSQILFKKTSGSGANYLENIYDLILWYGKSLPDLKYRRAFQPKAEELLDTQYTGRDNFRSGNDLGDNRFMPDTISSQGASEVGTYPIELDGTVYKLPPNTHWKASRTGMPRLARARRLIGIGKRIRYRRYADDFPVTTFANVWDDTLISGYADAKTYVVQTAPKVIERCILMTTDPGDLVLDPTCGSGTTAYVAEQWGRRWITIDTSRVALALARARTMGARYPWYLLADSSEGQRKEAEVTRSTPATTPTYGRIRQGFVYKRVPHITLKSIANNAEIDTIWAAYQDKLEPLREALNAALGTDWQEWEVPRELPSSVTPAKAGVSGGKGETDNNEIPAFAGMTDEAKARAKDLLADWWQLRIARQREIDASIAAKADTEFLYDQPYEDKSRVRVAGPFTVESLSPHRVPAVDVDDSLFDELEAGEGRYQGAGKREQEGDSAPCSLAPASSESADFAPMVLDNLRRSGVQQAHKADRLVFASLKPWPGHFICAEGLVRQASLDAVEGEAASPSSLRAEGEAIQSNAGTGSPRASGARDDDSAAPTRRAAILIGPEYGTVSRADLTAAAREAMEAGFDLLIAAAFNFDAHASEFDRMGALTVLQARINPDLHMPDLANTGAGNLFTVFGEPDIVVHDEGDGPNGEKMVSIEVAGVDMYKGGQIESSDADDIAVWFLDTDYDYENFFVRQAYFPGANDPYKALKTTLKAEIDADAWASLKRTRSRPFPRPKNGRVAVKVINHLGDEVMKVVEV